MKHLLEYKDFLFEGRQSDFEDEVYQRVRDEASKNKKIKPEDILRGKSSGKKFEVVLIINDGDPGASRTIDNISTELRVHFGRHFVEKLIPQGSVVWIVEYDRNRHTPKKVYSKNDNKVYETDTASQCHSLIYKNSSPADDGAGWPFSEYSYLGLGTVPVYYLGELEKIIGKNHQHQDLTLFWAGDWGGDGSYSLHAAGHDRIGNDEFYSYFGHDSDDTLDDVSDLDLKEFMIKYDIDVKKTTWNEVLKSIFSKHGNYSAYDPI